MEHRPANTKVYKENTSFCIDSLLSQKPKLNMKEERDLVILNRSSPASSPSNSFLPNPTSITQNSFPLLPPTSGFPPSSLPLMSSPPHPIEHLLKQELFPSQLPLEFLARSGLFYQNYPHFAGQLFGIFNGLFLCMNNRVSSFSARQDEKTENRLYFSAASRVGKAVQRK